MLLTNASVHRVFFTAAACCSLCKRIFRVVFLLLLFFRVFHLYTFGLSCDLPLLIIWRRNRIWSLRSDSIVSGMSCGIIFCVFFCDVFFLNDHHHRLRTMVQVWSTVNFDRYHRNGMGWDGTDSNRVNDERGELRRIKNSKIIVNTELILIFIICVSSSCWMLIFSICSVLSNETSVMFVLHSTSHHSNSLHGRTRNWDVRWVLSILVKFKTHLRTRCNCRT